MVLLEVEFHFSRVSCSAHKSAIVNEEDCVLKLGYVNVDEII